MIGVVIATFGDRDRWQPLAIRAADSVASQGDGMVCRIWWHSDTGDLADARNEGARQLIEFDGGPEPVTHLVFLDADDELGDGYLEAMEAAIHPAGELPCLWRPNTIGVYADGTTDPEPVMIPRTDMKRRNCAVIGTMVTAALFKEVGGFGHYPCLEDWALWRRMLAAGAFLVDVPAAVYRVHVDEGSRNVPSALMNDTYRRILKEIPL